MGCGTSQPAVNQPVPVRIQVSTHNGDDDPPAPSPTSSGTLPAEKPPRLEVTQSSRMVTPGSIPDVSGDLDGVAAIRADLEELKAAVRGIGARLSNTTDVPERPTVHRVVVTGGPCGGKSSSMEKLRSILEEQGLSVFVAPEVATILLGNGGDAIFRAPDSRKDACLYAFQRAILLTQIGLEDSFFRLAKAAGKPAVVLCDRGTLDGKAYSQPHAWNKLLSEVGVTEADLFRRYDAVVHMVTAADGAEDCYGDETNATRTESPEEARDVDERLRRCYLGHQAVHIIDNSTGFGEKVERACQPILQLVGKSRAVGPRQKFLLPSPVDTSVIPVPTVSALCTFVYLLGSTPHNLRRLRIREFHGTRQYSFQQVMTMGQRRSRVSMARESSIAEVVTPQSGMLRATSRSTDDDQRLVKEKSLSEKDYEHLVLQADVNCPVVRREHIFFCYDKHHYDIARFLDPPDRRHVTLLSVEAGRAADGGPASVKIPSFLTADKQLQPDASKPAIQDVLGFSPHLFSGGSAGFSAARPSNASHFDLSAFKLTDDNAASTPSAGQRVPPIRSPTLMSLATR